MKSRLDELSAEIRELSQSSISNPLVCGDFFYSMEANPVSGNSTFYRAAKNQAKKTPIVDLDVLRSTLAVSEIFALRLSATNNFLAIHGQDSASGRERLILVSLDDGTRSTIMPGNIHSLQWSSNRLYYVTKDISNKFTLHLYDPIIKSELTVAHLSSKDDPIVLPKSTGGRCLPVIFGSFANRQHVCLRHDEGQFQFLKSPLRHAVDAVSNSRSVYWIGRDDEKQSKLSAQTIDEPSSYQTIALPVNFTPEKLFLLNDQLAMVGRTKLATQILVYDSADFTWRKLYSAQPLENIVPAPTCGALGTGLVMTSSAPDSLPRLLTLDVAGSMRELTRSPYAEATTKQQKYVTAAAGSDGAAVPMSIVSSTAHSPVVLISYGAYGIPLSTAFRPWVYSLLNRGFSAAFCHVRGGGEIDAEWRAAGRGAGKLNTVRDLTACADSLRRTKANRKIVAYGRSAAAVATIRAALDRPGLFDGIVLEAPFLDLLGQMQSPEQATSSEKHEWGDPAVSLEYDSLRKLDPFRIENGDELPPTLILAKHFDTLTPWEESFRWITAARRSGTAKKGLILHTSLTADHSGEKLDYREWREEAWKAAFVELFATPCK